MSRLIAFVAAAVAAAAVALLAGARLGSAAAAGPFTVTVISASPYAFQDSNGNAPADLQVPLGSTVTFVNPSGGGFHDVDFDSLVPSACSGSASVDSTGASSGPWQGSCTFNSPGTYAFHCSIHLFTGEIVVSGGNGGGASGASGATGATGASGASGAGGAGVGGGAGAGTGPTGSSGTAGAGGGQMPPSSGGSGAAPASGHGSRGGTRPGGGPGATIASLKVPAIARGFGVSASALLGHQGSTLTAALLLGNSQTLGAVTRRRVGPGKVSFTVVLGARGRRLLRARQTLSMVLIVTVRAPDGTRVTRMRRLKLRV